ncbi:hypothetical protein [Haloferax mucosum]|uniref:hypothetical protein n=1 Tax=Haloferax mucosum TaxID=403181 RepID=UPI001375A2DD|nr:hypothetical protein [Haloferax mucosum]
MSVVSCAVCGRRVYSDDPHMSVEVNHLDEFARVAGVTDYVVHEYCGERVFAGWRKP